MEFKKKKLGYDVSRPLETFYVTMDDADESGLRSISVVRDPAIGVMALCFNKQNQTIMEFAAIQDQRKIVGPTMIPEMDLFRSGPDGDYNLRFSKDVIKKLVDKFNKNNNNKSINIDHSGRMVQGFISANWIVEDQTYDKSKYYGFNLPIGSHFMEVQVEDDQFWKDYVKAEPLGFSVEGIFGIDVSPQKFSKNYIDTLSDEEVIDHFKKIFSI